MRRKGERGFLERRDQHQDVILSSKSRAIPVSALQKQAYSGKKKGSIGGGMEDLIKSS